MRTSAIGFAATVIGLGALAFSAACADQPKPYCQSGRGEFAVRYKVLSGPADCAKRNAELFGIQSYNEKKDGDKPGEILPNVEKTPVAIMSVDLRRQADNAGSDDKAFALGIFRNPQPDNNDLCPVDMRGPVEITLDAVDETPADVTVEDGAATCTFLEPAAPQRTVKYDWTELTFYVTSAAAGTQFSGKVKITDSSFAGGATCEYEAIGMYPSVSCGKAKVACTPDLNLATSADPTLRATNPDPVQCTKDAPPDLVNQLPVGTSINPDFDVECAPVNNLKVQDTVPTDHLCLPMARFPAFKPSGS